MKLNAIELIRDLCDMTWENLEKAEALNKRSVEDLRWKPEPNSWNALECIEHLNLYGNFYLPEIEKVIKQKKYRAEELFTSGIIGNYFAGMMLPGKKSRKIKTFKDKDPKNSHLDKSSIENFIEQQKQLLELLKMATEVSLSRNRTSISISKWIKLRLGDTFRIVIYHNKRHLLQAFTVLEKKDSFSNLPLSAGKGISQQREKKS